MFRKKFIIVLGLETLNVTKKAALSAAFNIIS